MDAKESIAAAKYYVNDILADEHVMNLGVEEIEHDTEQDRWLITLSFSRPWNTPKTRAQEVLENMGAVSGLKRTYKVITLTGDGTVLSMKNRARTDILE